MIELVKPETINQKMVLKKEEKLGKHFYQQYYNQTKALLKMGKTEVQIYYSYHH